MFSHVDQVMSDLAFERRLCRLAKEREERRKAQNADEKSVLNSKMEIKGGN